jgi:putative SOS response-associated peptidase YedK
MCARFTLMKPSWADVWKYLHFEYRDEDADVYRPRWNVAPTNEHWIVQREAAKSPEGEDAGAPAAISPPPVHRIASRARWGLVPSWAKDPAIAARLINARGETLGEKPAFRAAYRHRRCVVPADGFYEWTGPKADRRPIWIHPPDEGLLLLAGLFEDWVDRSTGEVRRTFTIVTREATGAMRSVHDRMPALLRDDAIDPWLAAGPAPALEAVSLAPEGFEFRPVSKRVNSPRNDDPSLVEAVV